ADRRLYYERTTNLPSGVSPLFPALFLAASIAAFIESQLARRRLYRLSYLSSTLSPEHSADRASQSQAILKRIRHLREELNALLAAPVRAAPRAAPVLLFSLLMLAILFFYRLRFRGPARSFEGFSMDWIFCGVFVVLAWLIIIRALQLLVIWKETR